MLRKNTNPESKEFWKSYEKARLEIEKWPEWKKEIRVSKYSPPYIPHKEKIKEGVK